MTAEPRQWELLILTELTIKPYPLHNVPALALPAGMIYRFRYRRDHFDVGSPALSHIEGKWGLLVLRDQQVPDFTPVREFRVERVNEQGDTVFLELAFHRYVACDNGLGQYDQIISDALGDKSSQTRKGTRLDNYVVSVASDKLAHIPAQPSTTDPDYARAWADLVRILGQKEAFKGVRFFRLTRLYPVGHGRRLKPRSITEMGWGMGPGYELKGGTTYCLDVVCFAPADTFPDPHDVRLDGSDQFFQFPKKAVRTDGGYDLITLMLYVKPQTSSKQSAVLTVETEQQIDQQRIPPIFVPVEITWPMGTWLSRVIPAVCLVLGLAIILRVDWLASWTNVHRDIWALLGPILLGYGIGSFSLLTNLLAPRLQ